MAIVSSMLSAQTFKKCESLIEFRSPFKLPGVDLKSVTTDIEVTTKILRTAYECIKSHMSFSEHSHLLELQSLNGVNCGNILYSHHSCANITGHVAAEMCTEIVNHFLHSHAEFSILVDESTSIANMLSMCCWLRAKQSVYKDLLLMMTRKRLLTEFDIYSISLASV